MALPPPPPNEPPNEDWLTTYADSITLLMAFFVLLYSMSAIDEGKYAKLRDVLARKLGHRAGLIEKEVEAKATEAGDQVKPTPGFVAAQQKAEEHVEEELSEALAPMKEDGQANVLRTPKGIEIELAGDALFKPGSVNLTRVAREKLGFVADRYVGSMMEHHDLEIEGHSDSTPTRSKQFQSNWDIAGVRAARVADFFESHGADARRVRATSYGDARPKVPNTDYRGQPIPENQAKNRRIVVRMERGAPAGQLTAVGLAGGGEGGPEPVDPARVRLPEASGRLEPAGEGYAVRVSRAAVRAADMEEIAVVGDVPEGADGAPPSLPFLRDAISGRTAHVLADEAAPWRLVAPVLFSAGELGSAVQVAARERGSPPDATRYGLLPVRLAPAEGGPGKPPPPPVSVKVKVAVKGGLAKDRGRLEIAAEDSVPRLRACVQEHADGAVSAKYKFLMSYDEGGYREKTTAVADPFGGVGPTPCVTTVLDTWHPGTPSKRKASKVKVTISVKTLPGERAAAVAEGVRVVVATGGYTVALPDGSSLGLEGGPEALVERLRAEGGKLPAGSAVFLYPRFDVPHRSVVGLVAALRGAGGLVGDVAVGPALE